MIKLKSLINEGQWKPIGGEPEQREKVIIHEYVYKETYYEKLLNFFKRMRKDGIIGNVPRIKKITATFYQRLDDLKHSIVIYIDFASAIEADPSNPLISTYKFDRIHASTNDPFTTFDITAIMEKSRGSVTSRRTETIEDQNFRDLIKQLISELKPEIQKYI